MLTLYLNTTTREWFDVNGNPLPDKMPRLTFLTSETILIYPKRTTPNAGEVGCDTSKWGTDYLLAPAERMSAKLTIDSDYIHKLNGTLSASIGAGSVTEVTVRFAQTVTLSEIATAGTLRLFASNGVDFESVQYTSRHKLENGDIVFTIADSANIDNDYVNGAKLDCDQAPYCTAFYSPVNTSAKQGAWGFDLVVDSQRLRDKLEYSNVSEVAIKGLELLIYAVDSNGNEQPVQAFLQIQTISSTIG
jgi:hypothetical protein